MNKLFNLLSVGIITIFVTSCSMSDSEFLKSSTEKINKMTAKMEKVENAFDYQSIANEYQKLIDSAPSTLMALDEEELCKVEGGEEFMEAVANFAIVSASAAGKVSMNTLDSFNNMVSAVESIVEEASSYDDDEDEDDEDEYNDPEDVENDGNYSEDELAMAKMIDEYEKIVNKFISNQKGGMDIFTNSSTYESALNLASKIEELGELPSKLDKRFYDLQYKLTRAYTFGADE